ncbi:exonuclease domain-containing protein, partial [Escherichia coli]
MTKLDEFLSNVSVLDTETTGVESEDDIIEFSISYPHDAHENIDTIDNYTLRYKPLKDIPPEASAVHFISTEDVANCIG